MISFAELYFHFVADIAKKFLHFIGFIFPHYMSSLTEIPLFKGEMSFCSSTWAPLHEDVRRSGVSVSVKDSDVCWGPYPGHFALCAYYVHPRDNLNVTMMRKSLTLLEIYWDSQVCSLI
jgi:hypothetical protein